MQLPELNLKLNYLCLPLVEKVNILGKGEINTKIILMARNKEDVLLLIYNIRQKRFDYDVADVGKEWKNKPVTGWKKGIEDGKPKCQII